MREGGRDWIASNFVAGMQTSGFKIGPTALPLAPGSDPAIPVGATSDVRIGET